MTEKRFSDDGVEEIENQSFTDNLAGKTYWIDHGLDEIVDLLNNLNEEKETNKGIVDELDGLLNKYGLSFEELEDAIQYYVEDRGAR